MCSEVPQSDKQQPRSNEYIQQTDQNIKQQLELLRSIDHTVTGKRKNKRAQKLCAKSYARNQEQPKYANRCEPAIQAMQYFHSISQRDGQNDKTNPYKIINQKIKLQWQSSLQENGSYQLIGREEAAANIQKWYGDDARTLFNCCALPAMQADFLRVAFLAQHTNALYIDWPHRPIHPEGLLTESHIQTDKSLLATRLRGSEQRI